MTIHWHKIMRWIGYTLASFIIIAAAIVSISRLFTPMLMEHRKDFEKWASEFLHTPVTIKHVHISWYYYQPELSFDQVEILDSHTHKPTFQIQQIKVNLEIFKSIFKRQPIPAYIKISGVHVTIHEQEPGKVNVAGIGSFAINDNMTGAGIGGNAVADWVTSQRHLVLDDIDFIYFPLHGDTKSVTLHKLSLKNSGIRHELTGEATLNQDIPTHMLIDFKWHGQSFDLSTISAHLYIYIEAISLPQWIKNHSWEQLKVNQGLGSVKIWADWNHNQWQKVQSEFQLYELELQSLITKKSQTISRLNGSIGWKREGNQQRLVGEDILIDFPEHIWPTTSFSINLNPDANGKYQLKELNIGYLDLADCRELLIASGSLPEKWQNTLTALNPAGEVRNVAISFNDPVTLLNNPMNAEFTNFSVKEWQSVPGLTHFTGELSWDGKQGDLLVNSDDMILTLSSVFNNPLTFSELTGDIRWQKDTNNNWSLKAKHIEAHNAELSADVNMDMIFSKDSLPHVDLNADFSLNDAADINHYLPNKIFDSELVNWLQHAFVGGHIESGKAIVQGNLRDFPFDNGNGKFLITGQIKDLDFHYAPKWPAIEELNGQLTFSGHSMIADIDSGHLLDIPLTHVRGTIPYIGSHHPQVLEVKGVIHSDLLHGMQFIHESPLQKSIGGDLSLMQLTGPMQLDLFMSIPLKTPERTQVLGDVALNEGELKLPAWNVAIQHLTGAFQFTEDSLKAKQLTGRLFNHPINIHIDTIKPAKAPSFIQTTLASQMTIQDLQTLLGFDLSRFAEGSFNYTTEINLMSQAQAKPSQIILRTNLQGVTLNLPDKFAKKANDIQNLELSANISKTGPLLAKARYDKLMSAAITLQKSDEHMTFQSGEIRLGNQGTADWQKQSGLIVTGQWDSLNWDAIKEYSASNQESNMKLDLSYLRSVDVRIKKALAFGQTFNNARLQLTQADNNWILGIDSSDAVGQIVIPRDMQQVIQAKFDRLTIKPMAAGGARFDPKSLPALSFVGSNVNYNDIRLGQVALDIEPNQTGLIIKSLQLNSSIYTLTANGQWWSDNKGSRTRLEGKLTSKNVSEFLQTFGVKSSNLVGSGGTAIFDLAWPDAPYRPTMSGMTGTLDLKLTKGRIVDLGESTDAKIGFGRMLNVFSLQTLPRRLSLDFSDLFQKGYSFDSLNGTFTFKNGSALTNNTRFDGPLAQVVILGRIGFTAKDFDLTLRITPYVTSSLPLVATAIGGPVAGAVTFVLNKAVGSAVSKVTTYRYRVQGPWDNPNWSEIKK